MTLANSHATDARPTVCFFIPAFTDGGAQRQCISIINELSQRDDFRILLIRTGSGIHDHLLDSSRIDVRMVPIRSHYDPRVILRVRRILRETRARVLFSWLQAADVPSYFIRAITPRLRWVLSERNSYYDNELRFRLRTFFGRRADAIVSNSEAGDRYWQKLAPRGKRYVIKNIVSSDLAPSRPEDLPRRYDVVTVGRIVDQKNPLATVDAFAATAALDPDLTFAFVGDGSMRPDVERRIAELGLSTRIHVLGFRRDAGALVANARLLVTLSHFEGMPNVLVEAVTLGTPILASDIPQHRDLLGDRYSHLVSEYNDPHAVAAAIVDALTAGTTDLGHVKDELTELTAENVGSAYTDVFNKTMNRPRSRCGRRSTMRASRSRTETE